MEYVKNVKKMVCLLTNKLENIFAVIVRRIEDNLYSEWENIDW